MRAGLILAGVGMASCLAGCANTSGLNATLNTLEQNYAHCHHTVTYSATVGALNPGSGAQVQGTIDCPAVSPTGTTAAPSVAATQ